ncbi:hypothetical protein EDC82_2333 [Dermacoccus sp. SAI-028]|nr:hypothetical protein EDC82_2333 [Dermacoccus sp. SAI-028]
MEHRMTTDVDARPSVRVRYWAGAAQAAGCDEESLPLAVGEAPQSPEITGRDVRTLIMRAHPDIEAVLARCSLLHGGRRLADDASFEPADVVEVLPPFVGG